MRLVSTLSLIAALTIPSRAALAQDDAPATALGEAPPTHPAWTDKVGYQAESGTASTYVFRGRYQYVDHTDASQQSTAAFTVKDLGPGAFSFTAWNAQVLNGSHPQAGNATEIDLTPSYAFSVAHTVDATVGYTAYLYPQHLASQPVDGSHELFGVLSYTNRFVTPSLGVYGDFLRLHGVYASAGVSRTWNAGPVQLTPQLSLGVADYAGVETRLNDVSGIFAAEWDIRGPFYLSGRIAYSFMGGPTADLPGKDGSASGRSAPWGLLAFGLKG